MVVTFNENIKCHHYGSSAAPAEGNADRIHPQEMASSNSRQQSRYNYDLRYLMSLRDGPHSQVCPDVVKKGIEDEKGWTGSAATDPPAPKEPRQPYPYNRRLIPFYQGNDATNFGGHDELLEPISRRNFMRRIPPVHNNYSNRFPVREYAPRYAVNQQSSMKNTKEEEEDEPPWVKDGPSSPNDCIELHGFPENHENHLRNEQLGCVDGNISGGPTSGASSNNGSPPAKSTPTKFTSTTLNDTQRNMRPAVGRPNNWQINFDNRPRGVGGSAPFINEFFKNFSGTQTQSNYHSNYQSNVRGSTPIEHVEDVESSLLYDRLKFRHMIAQLQNQNLGANMFHPHHEPIPSAAQILAEIEKILRDSTNPVYKRPEVRTLIKNIFEAVIPPINIMNLLKNPLTEPQNRETIQSAVKIITQAKQTATNAMKIHTPTVAELRAHMDAIMQDAIIKKRMENLNHELLKVSYQRGGRNFPNQTFHQLFRQNTPGRFGNHSQGDTRGQWQPFENPTTLAPENNLNRWFSPTLLNKGLSGELPQIPNNPLRSEELEIKQKFRGNEKEVK